MADESINVARENIEAFNAGDWNRVKSTLAPDSVYDEVGTQRRIQGADQIIEAFKGWRQAMPDVKGTVTNALASGNTATLQITWEGTQTGPLAGPGLARPKAWPPASGREASGPAAWRATAHRAALSGAPPSRKHGSHLPRVQEERPAAAQPG